MTSGSTTSFNHPTNILIAYIALIATEMRFSYVISPWDLQHLNSFHLRLSFMSRHWYKTWSQTWLYKSSPNWQYLALVFNLLKYSSIDSFWFMTVSRNCSLSHVMSRSVLKCSSNFDLAVSLSVPDTPPTHTITCLPHRTRQGILTSTPHTHSGQTDMSCMEICHSFLHIELKWK